MGINRADKTYYTRVIRIVLLFVIVASISEAFWGQRICCEGEMWLNWNNERRESYMWGYMVGYSHAYWDGCRQAMNSLPVGVSSESIERSCRGRQPDFSRGTTYWAQQVTQFYKTYPNDLDIGIDEILDQLRNGLTLEQIHKYPFMRRRSQGIDAVSKPK